jgi:hypothetical protein
MGWGIGIGIGWPNASASNSPTVYTYQVTNCGGPQGPVYSTASVFEAGIVLYLDSGLTSLVDYNAFGEPFNVGSNEPAPGYFCHDDGVVDNSSIEQCP